MQLMALDVLSVKSTPVSSNFEAVYAGHIRGITNCGKQYGVGEQDVSE